MYCNHTGLLRLALCPAYTTDCNYDCPCLLCSQHHNHKRQELYLSSGQQQIPPFRDKASSILAPSTRDHSMPMLATKVRRMLLAACNTSVMHWCKLALQDKCVHTALAQKILAWALVPEPLSAPSVRQSTSTWCASCLSTIMNCFEKLGQAVFVH